MRKLREGTTLGNIVNPLSFFYNYQSYFTLINALISMVVVGLLRQARRCNSESIDKSSLYPKTPVLK